MSVAEAGHMGTSPELPPKTRSVGQPFRLPLGPPLLLELNSGTNIESSGCQYSFDDMIKS